MTTTNDLPNDPHQPRPNPASSPAPPSEGTSRQSGGRRRIDLGNRSNDGSKNRGDADLAALFVNAQRRNADKQRKAQGDRPKPPNKQKPSEPATPKPDPRQPREIPKPTTPATRTIHAALGVSRRRDPAASKRVYPSERSANPEFQRGPSARPSSRQMQSDDIADSSKPEVSEQQQQSGTPPRRQLYQPKQQDSTGRSPMRTAPAGKQLFNPKANPPAGTSVLLNKSSAVETPEDRSISPLPPTLLSAPAVGGANAAADTLKQAYREVQELEAECLKEAEQQRRQTEDGNFRRNKSGSASHLLEGFEDPIAYWITRVQRHKELAEAHHNFLFVASDPLLSAPLRTMPHKNNTPLRLWQHAIHLLLERLRHAIADSPDLTELFLDFVHYAYSFYTCLLEDHTLDDLRHIWLEQLGDLARYRMAVANIMTKQQASVASSSPTLLSSQAVEMINQTTPPQARIDDEGDADWGEPASFGLAALEDIETDDVKIWKETALEWYSRALAESPQTGRLHHHLALLHRQDELKCLYHFCKSLVAANPYYAANESILSLFGAEDQERRLNDDAGFIDLFIRLQGMIVTRTSLDQFDEVLDRLIDKLAEAEKKKDKSSLTTVRWIMVSAIVVTSLLGYGKPDAFFVAALKQQKAPGSTKKQKNKAASNTAPQTILLKPASTPRQERSKTDVDTEDSSDEFDDVAQTMQELHLEESGDAPSASKTPAEQNIPQACAEKLAFRLLRFVAQHATAPSSINLLNPYVTVLVTFLSRVFSVAFSQSFPVLEKQLPWQELIALLNQMPSNAEVRHDPPTKLSGPPLPEDWSLRGMDWAEHGLYVRGFWNVHRSEKEDTPSAVFESEFAVLESETEERFAPSLETPANSAAVVEEVAAGRWKRLAATGSNFVRRVPGLSLDLEGPEGKKFKLSNAFAQKISTWRKEDAAQAQRRQAQRVSASAGAHNAEEVLFTDDSDKEGDDQSVLDIKAKRREFRALIRHSRAGNLRRASTSAADAKPTRPVIPVQARPNVQLFSGFTVLVADATILLKALPLLQALLDSRKWTVVVPLAVINDIDGKREDRSAVDAISFLERHVKSHPLHLKIQTSKGNYLQDLRFRSEDIAEGQKQDTVTLVLRCALWQQEHFINRVNLIHPSLSEDVPDNALKVVLLTLNQKFRQKSRGQGVEALNDVEILDLAAKLPESNG